MKRLKDVDPELAAKLDEQGEPMVRSNYDANQVYGGGNRPKVHMWLLEQEEDRQARAEARESTMVSAAWWSAVAAAVSAIAAVAAIVAALMHKG